MLTKYDKMLIRIFCNLTKGEFYEKKNCVLIAFIDYGFHTYNTNQCYG